MAFKPQSDDESAMSEINVTPLVDVMLVLVIILLVTAPLISQSVKLKLPDVKSEADTQKQPLQLDIDEQGTLTLNKVTQTDLAMLETNLKAELAKDAEIQVHMYADQAVVFARVAEVMARVQQMGIYKIVFVTREQ